MKCFFCDKKLGTDPAICCGWTYSFPGIYGCFYYKEYRIICFRRNTDAQFEDPFAIYIDSNTMHGVYKSVKLLTSKRCIEIIDNLLVYS